MENSFMSLPLGIALRDSPIANLYSAGDSHGALTLSKPVLVVVEGVNDIEFLRRMSRVLHANDAETVDLGLLEQADRLVFVPQGGGDLVSWTHRLAPLGHPEFHLYDRESGSATAGRRRTVNLINERPCCRAFLTSKRTLENYLHPAALFEARGIDIKFGDSDDVAATVAQHVWNRACKPISWTHLPLRARNRLRAKVKRWLNTEAVARMTHQRLAERDPQGEVMSWLYAITHLASHS
jgi:hypothetical protein